MDGAFVAGLLLTVGGLLGYAIGLFVQYPGRAFTVTAVMVGLTLVSIGRIRTGDEETEPPLAGEPT